MRISVAESNFKFYVHPKVIQPFVFKAKPYALMYPSNFVFVNSLDHKMGGAYSSKFTPGFMPTDTDRPQRHLKCEGILEAYREAVVYVNENKDGAYCTVGPGNWVKCWKKEEKQTPVKVKSVEENIILCYHEKLTIAFPEGVDAKAITASKYDS